MFWDDLYAADDAAMAEIRSLDGCVWNSRIEEQMQEWLWHDSSEVRAYAMAGLISRRPAGNISLLIDRLGQDYSPNARVGHVMTAADFVRHANSQQMLLGESAVVRDALTIAAVHDPVCQVRDAALNELERLGRSPEIMATQQLYFPAGEEWAPFDQVLMQASRDDRIDEWLKEAGSSGMVDVWKERGPTALSVLGASAGVSAPSVLDRILSEGKASISEGAVAAVALAGIALDVALARPESPASVALAVRCWRDNVEPYDKRYDGVVELLFRAQSLGDIANDRSGFVLDALRRSGL